MSNRWRSILLGGVLVAACAAATAQPGSDDDARPRGGWPGNAMRPNGGPGMMGHPGMMGPGAMGYHGMMTARDPRWMERLDLDDGQRKQVRQILDAQRRQHWEAMGRVMEQQVRLRDLMDAETPDPKAAGEAYGAIAQVHRELFEAGIRTRNEIRKLLSPEQRQALDSWGKGRRGRDREGRGGSGQGPGRGPGMGPGMGPGTGPGMSPGMNPGMGPGRGPS